MTKNNPICKIKYDEESSKFKLIFAGSCFGNYDSYKSARSFGNILLKIKRNRENGIKQKDKIKVRGYPK